MNKTDIGFAIDKHDIRDAFFNSAWLYLDRILRLAIGLFVGIWIVRYLGPQQYGMFNYAAAYAAIFSAFAALGLDAIVVRDLVSRPESSNHILGSAFFLKLAGGVVTFTLSCLTIPFVKSGDPQTLLLVAVIAAGNLFLAFDVIGYWYQAQVRSKYSVYAKNIPYVLISALKVVLILVKAPLVAFAWASTIELLFGAIGLGLIYTLQGKSLLSWRWDKNEAWYLLVESWPIFLSFLAFMLYSRVDQILIGNLLGTTPVGIYAASTRLFEIPLAGVLVVATSFTPLLIKLYEREKNAFYRIYEQITTVFTLLSFIILAIVYFCSGPLILLFYGPSYIAAKPILDIQMFGLVFMFNAGLRSTYLTITSNQKILLITTVFSAVLNVGLNLILIPRYHTGGSAVATVVTQVVSLLILNCFFKATRKIFVIQLRAMVLLPFLRLFDQRRIDEISPV